MSIVARHPQTYSGVIANLDFWPALDIAVFQTKYRVDTSVKKEVLEEALMESMMLVNDQLEARMLEWQASGFTTINEVEPAKRYPSATLRESPSDSSSLSGVEADEGTVSEYEIAYLQAVYCHAKAFSLRDYAQHDLTNEGDERWQDNNQQARDYERRHTAAIRKLKGKIGATSVNLI